MQDRQAFDDSIKENSEAVHRMLQLLQRMHRIVSAAAKGDAKGN
jgi:hypothetical protein